MTMTPTFFLSGATQIFHHDDDSDHEGLTHSLSLGLAVVQVYETCRSPSPSASDQLPLSAPEH